MRRIRSGPPATASVAATRFPRSQMPRIRASASVHRARPRLASVVSCTSRLPAIGKAGPRNPSLASRRIFSRSIGSETRHIARLARPSRSARRRRAGARSAPRFSAATTRSPATPSRSATCRSAFPCSGSQTFALARRTCSALRSPTRSSPRSSIRTRYFSRSACSSA